VRSSQQHLYPFWIKNAKVHFFLVFWLFVDLVIWFETRYCRSQI